MSLIENRIYYPSGALKLLEFHRDWKLEGERKVWYENGELSTHDFFRDGIDEGLYRSWYRNGQPSLTVQYLAGKREGEYKIWHDNGCIEIRGFYQNGQREGCYKFWRSDGLIYAYVIYKNGEPLVQFRYFPDINVQVLDWMIVNSIFKTMKPSHDFSFQKRQILLRLKTRLQKIGNLGKYQISSPFLIIDLLNLNFPQF